MSIKSNMDRYENNIIKLLSILIGMSENILLLLISRSPENLAIIFGGPRTNCRRRFFGFNLFIRSP